MTTPALRGISSMATRQVLADLVAGFAQQTGLQAAIESVGGVDAAKRVAAGEAFDVVILASDAELTDPHTSIGQVTAYEGIALALKSPMESILRMALVGSAERMPAERAYQLGICSQVVDPPDRLRDAAQELAEKVAQNSPAAMTATKKALWGALEMGLSDACRAGGKDLAGMWGHPDQEEGPMAFAEKREAAWLPLPERDADPA